MSLNVTNKEWLNSEPTMSSEFGNISEQALQVDDPVKMTITKQLKEFFSVLLLLCVFLLVNGGKKLLVTT